MDYSEYHMTKDGEDQLEDDMADCPVKDTRDAMFAAYKEAGYHWCEVRDAFIYPGGYWIGRQDAMKKWLNY